MPALRVCSTPGCPTLVTRGRCAHHERQADRARGTATERGYSHQHRAVFRAAVLKKNPTCVLCNSAPATVADHYPLSRRELEALGLDPNDPCHGRGLCSHCDGPQTAGRQPGGWNAR